VAWFTAEKSQGTVDMRERMRGNERPVDHYCELEFHVVLKFLFLLNH
jgi:hypothetical protein